MKKDQCVDIQALMRVLPISGLEPQCVASLRGLVDTPENQQWRETIQLLESPAGQHVPYIEPVGALQKLLRRQGLLPEAAQVQALAAVARMREGLAKDRWVKFFDENNPESPDCLPVPEFLAWLRAQRCQDSRQTSGACPEIQGTKDLADDVVLVPPDILDFFEHSAQLATTTPMFRGPDNWEEILSMENLPALPPLKAMIEFVPRPPWADDDESQWFDDPGAYYRIYGPFHRWREAMRPIAQSLEKALGEPVYYFANLASDIDDDDVHRFLVLHWCCTHKPESAYVRYLLKVSGAADVEALKAALIDPASYTQPFKMNSAFFGMEVQSCRLSYRPSEGLQTSDIANSAG